MTKQYYYEDDTKTRNEQCLDAQMSEGHKME